MKSHRLLSIPLLCFLFFGCQDILECAIGRSAHIPNKTFPIGSTSEYYYVEFDAEVKNEPRDNDYDYFFEVRESSLPGGISYYANYRTLSIEGLATETGVFEIEVYLYVEGPLEVQYDNDGDAYYHDPLCDNTITKTYTLIIE